MKRVARAVAAAFLGVLLVAADRSAVPGDDATAGAAGTNTGPSASAEQGASLERLRREADARRGRVEAYARQEQGLLDTIEAIDRAAAQIASDLVVARRDASAAATVQVALDERLHALEAESAVTRRALADGMRRLYREGQSRTLRLLAGADSLRDLLGRIRTARYTVEHDAQMLARAQREREALEGARAEVAAAARASAKAIARERGRARALDEERASKGEVLSALRVGGARERAALAEIEAAARALEAALAGLGAAPPARSTPAEPFATLRGRLRAPVAAPIARGFGRVVDAEFGTATFRKGIDFAAPAGAPVYPVAPGDVRFAGWFRGYGKMVIVDHGESYFTVYAHLDALDVAVGEAAALARPIGTVGDTGSLGGPLLYFEIRRGSEPLDPVRWLAGGTGLE